VRLAEGAARAGRSLTGFEIAPSVSVHISDDIESARDFMRPALALYVGGMGSRRQNFYNALVCEYGFERAAAEVQNLYLDGRRDAACRAIPDELVDMVSLVGPREMVAERLVAYRDAGVGTLLVSPLGHTREQQFEQLQTLAEIAS
jgi:alkanesulfonate monooxygenase SsuD/methylene tetrahydromethanopterin reductase-like flavin-dependent oxidoreductase (luciferase family)